MRPEENPEFYQMLTAPEGIEEKYATFALLGEPGYVQRYMEVHYVGAVGTAKTSAMCDAAGLTLLEYPHSQNFLARDYAKYLEESTLATFKRRWRTLFDDGTFRHIKSDDLIVCDRTGATLHLLGLDAPKAVDRLVGSEWFRGFIDQAEGIEEVVFNKTLLRLRQDVWHESGVKGWNYIKTTSNWHKGKNWIWKRCVPNSSRPEPDLYERKVEGLVGGKPQVAYRMYIEARFGENLSVNSQYGSALLLAGNEARRFISDGPVPGEGLVWPEWDDQLHGIERVDDFAGLPMYGGLDSGIGGINHPTYCAFATLDQWGAAEIVREYMYPQPNDPAPAFRSARQNAEAIARLLLEYNARGVSEFRIFADLALWEMDTSGRTAAQDYQEVWAKLPFVVTLLPANRNRRGSIERGNDAVRHLLTDTTPFGTPRLRVSRRDAPNAFEMMGTITTEHVHKDTWGIVDVYDGVRYLAMNLPQQGWYGRRKNEPYEAQKLVWN